MQARPVPGGATNRPGAVRNPDLVGRDRELEALRDALSSVPAVVLVEGEAGVGKSRLVREFLARAGGGRTVLVGVCPPLREPYTLAPLLDAVHGAVDRVGGLPLSPLAGALRPLFPEWVEDLPPAPEPLEDARAARHRLFRALVELLGCLDVSVLVLEDAHWADEATVEFLLFLAHRQPPAVPGLVVTCRREDVPPGSLLPRLWSRPPTGGTLTRLPLVPLDVAATAALVSSMLDDDRVSDGFAEFLHERTDGIPLVVEESVRLLHDRADLVRRDGEWFRRHLDHIAVPPTVRDAVLERAGRLGPEAQAVLRAAAVLDDPSESSVLVEVAGLDVPSGAAGLAEAVRCGLLQDDGRGWVSIRHAIAARAVYAAIPAPDRRTAHRRAARVLERLGRQPAARLAYHFRHAGDVGSWVRHAGAAVDVALSTGDEATAGSLLHDLLTNADLPPAAMLSLAGKLPLASMTDGTRLREVLAALRSALATAPLGAEEEAQLRAKIGSLLMCLDEHEEGLAELERAAHGLSPGTPGAVSTMTFLSQYQGPDRPVSAHLNWLRRADEAAAATSMTPAARIGWVVARATALLSLGEEEGWVEATRLPDTAETSNELARVANGHLNIGDQALRWGRHAEARRLLGRALELSEKHEYLRFTGLARTGLVCLDWLTGAWDGLAERAAALAADEDLLPVSRSEAVLVLGLLRAATGAHEQAWTDLSGVLEARRRCGRIDLYGEPAAALGALALSRGRVEEALAVTDQPVGIIAGKGTWVWGTDVLPVRVDALVAAGRTGAADGLVEAFADGLGRRDAPAPQASLLSCRALVASGAGEHNRAAGLFARATEAWAALPRPYDALLARERLARCQLAVGEREAGLGLLSEVFRDLSGLGARAGAERVLRTLREHGVEVKRPPWMGGPRGYGDRLSPRESDVVRLVVAGRTNREIAAELSRSPMTVANQLRSAMRKLGVSSRTALAVKVTAAGHAAGDAAGSGANGAPDRPFRPNPG